MTTTSVIEGAWESVRRGGPVGGAGDMGGKRRGTDKIDK
jgi:hypothetical protein